MRRAEVAGAPGAPGWARHAGAAALTVAVAAGVWALAGEPRVAHARLAVSLGFAACGLVSGFLCGLLGIGGALVVVPCMYVLLPGLGVPMDRVPHVAVGSSLLAMIPSALAAARAQYLKGALDVAWLRRLAPGMALGAAAGALLALELRGVTLTAVFAVQSLYYGWGLMRGAPPAPGWRSRIASWSSRLPPSFTGPAVALFCACAGMGGGSLIVPYLLGRGVTLLRAVATASALNLAIAVAGAVAFMSPTGSGDAAAVCWPAALLVGGCAVPCVASGVRLAHRLPVAVFRRLLGAVTLIGATVLMARAWG